MWSALCILFRGLNVNITSLVSISLLTSKSNVFAEIQNATVNHIPQPCPLSSSFVCTSFIISVSLTYIYRVGESKEFTADVHETMARAVYPTLTELLRLNGEKFPLPSHCFVYGIHLSPIYLTLCLHFPTKTTDRKTKICGWEFRQVVAARYLIGCQPHTRNLHENLILLRWRLLISLFTVLKHVQLLSTKLRRHATETNASVPNPSLW